MERIVRRHRVKIKVVERVGTAVKRTLQKSDPFLLYGEGVKETSVWCSIVDVM